MILAHDLILLYLSFIASNICILFFFSDEKIQKLAEEISSLKKEVFKIIRH